MITRVRLRDKETVRIPFRTFYIVSEAHVPSIFRMFGISFSVRITPTLRTRLENIYIDASDGKKNDTKVSLRVPYEANARIVVVLRHPNRRALSLEPFTAHRFLAEAATKKNDRLEEIQRVIDPGASLIHFGPGKEGAKPICHFCSNTLSNLMGVCTPGDGVCHEHVVVPIDSLLRKP